ncbi:FecR family protein [Mucilaginibacter sp.]|uniref:FecR family protein n=1 Tax=Mucilaginibacter sp. TaxID=1882438 RepID=UPI0026323C70|nr:FecR family protein [Mucilaginibacter sp.]MDB4927307.1 fec operon regulator FecR [Mucilaginibacter sp.]
MEENILLDQLVERYIDNQASEKELEVFFFLLEQGKLDDILMKYMDKSQQTYITNNISLASQKPGKVKFIYNTRAVAAAAVVLVFLLAGIFLYNTRVLNQDTAVKYAQISTHNGELKSIELSDGSIVFLNSNSTLKYTDNFNGDKRMVELLEGEAYFDIKHDAAKPFVVKTGKILTNVLGTSFNIRSFKYINEVKITVTKGKVGVQSNYTEPAHIRQVILIPDEQADINRNTGSIIKNKVKSADILNWREGGLYFDNENFRDVSAILETKFGYAIKFANDDIPNYRFTAGFKSTENLIDILNALCLANNLKYKIANKTVLLKIAKNKLKPMIKKQTNPI